MEVKDRPYRMQYWNYFVESKQLFKKDIFAFSMKFEHTVLYISNNIIAGVFRVKLKRTSHENKEG